MRFIVVFLILALSACGFKPANQTIFDNNTSSTMRSSVPPIRLPQTQSKSEFLLKSALQKKLPGNNGQYSLTWTYTSGFTGSNLSVNDNYQRFNKSYRLSWSLYDSQNRRVKSGNSRTTIAIDILRTGYPFEAALQDADRQAADVIAQDVYNQLQMHFGS